MFRFFLAALASTCLSLSTASAQSTGCNYEWDFPDPTAICPGLTGFPGTFPDCIEDAIDAYQICNQANKTLANATCEAYNKYQELSQISTDNYMIYQLVADLGDPQLTARAWQNYLKSKERTDNAYAAWVAAQNAYLAARQPCADQFILDVQACCDN